MWQGLEDKKVVKQCTMTIMTDSERKLADFNHFTAHKTQCKRVEVRGATGRYMYDMSIHSPCSVYICVYVFMYMCIYVCAC